MVVLLSWKAGKRLLLIFLYQKERCLYLVKSDHILFLLTPFMKIAPYPHCQQKFVMFSAISSFVDKKYIESFCHFINENTVEHLVSYSHIYFFMFLNRLDYF
ncbi:hypothetical protein Hanom_Chr16g01448311 [Helianthus anomalus]